MERAIALAALLLAACAEGERGDACGGAFDPECPRGHACIVSACELLCTPDSSSDQRGTCTPPETCIGGGSPEDGTEGLYFCMVH